MNKLHLSSLPRWPKPLLCSIALLGISIASSYASTLLFYDDFSGYLGVQTSSTMGPWTLNGNTIQEGQDRKIEVLADTQNLFGQGTDNHYLSFYTAHTQVMTMRATNAFSGAGSVVTLSFSLYVPDKEGYERPIDIRAGTSTIQQGNIANRAILAGNTLSGASFAIGTPLRIDIIFNAGQSTLDNYHEGSSLAPLSFDVWADGERIVSGMTTTNANAINGITSISFQSLSNSTEKAEFYIDWVAVTQGASVMAPIPEPSSALLFLPTTTLACLWALRSKLR